MSKQKGDDYERQWEVETTSENDSDDMPPLEDVSDGKAYAEEGELYVTRHALNTQIKVDETYQQRENIFHTRCSVNNKVCMIIDGGSCTNVASNTLVEKLGLPLLKHPRPYKLQWLNDCGEVKVNKQVLVSFNIGRYNDKVLCDVVPMLVGHILLGRPWQYDRKVMHDGFSNRYYFVKDGKSVTLVPLSPKQVYEDQMKLLSDVEKKRKSESETSRKNESEKESVEREGKTKMSFYARESEVRKAFMADRLMIFMVYKESYPTNDETNQSLPSLAVSL